MMNTFVCKLFDSDSFHVKGATVVNLNDNNQYNYTFWNLSKKLYCIPYTFTKEALDLFYISLMVFYVAKTEHSHPLGMLYPLTFDAGKGLKEA